jgi:hypothetical protein
MDTVNTRQDLEIKRLAEAVEYLIKYITTLSTHREMRQAMTVINQEFSNLASQVVQLQAAVDNGDIVQYVESEVPTGDIDGVNATFTLAHAPIPSTSLMLFVGGVLLIQDTDYTLDSEIISITNPALIPPLSGTIVAFYKY